MKIALLTSAHQALDDRIFYHQAKSLLAKGDEVQIISSLQGENEIVDGITIQTFDGSLLSRKQKIHNFINYLNAFEPDRILCSEPLAVLAAARYTSLKREAKVVYDITEWYPSKKNLVNSFGPNKYFHFLRLLLFNLYAGCLSDAFLFGEHYKSLPFRKLFYWKKYHFASYYPGLNYIPHKKPDLQPNRLRLCYSGKISIEKGFGNFISVVKELHYQRPELLITLRIIGWFSPEDESACRGMIQDLPANIKTNMSGILPFSEFLHTIRTTDIFIDLRWNDFENNHCLPIKLFYYASLGRPVIFSDLKAIRKEVDIQKFGYLLSPYDTKTIVSTIIDYLDTPELYSVHCSNARAMSVTRYNWEKIEDAFVSFVHNLG